MRPINWSLFISFARQLDPSASFFTVGVSTVGSADIIKGEDSVLQLWDQYQYFDYSNRVITMEWSQSMDPQYSVQSAMGDLVLNNYDDYLSGDNFALPNRPLRIGVGFGNSITGSIETLPQFVGITQKAPTIDHATKTVSYHVVDFMASLFNRPLTAAVILTNVRTDEALDTLLQLMGLSPTQYDLDIGFNVIPFLFFDTSIKFGDAVNQLMQAEMGRLYMTETGRITFLNRQNFSSNSVWYFDSSNVIDYQTRTEDNIVNVVEITSNVRLVQPNQNYWQSTTATVIPANTTIDIFANFTDPVLTVDAPVQFSSSSTSYWLANSASDSSGSNIFSGLGLLTTRFATSYKMTFTNSTSNDIYITNIVLFATPAPAIRTVYVRQQDDTSVTRYDEHLLQITNDFFVDEQTARSKALVILGDNPFGIVTHLTVKGNPALQIGDAITAAVRERTYITETGDTLTTIATAYGMSLSQVEALNPQLGPAAGRDFSVVFPGDEVHLGIIPEDCVIVGIGRKLDTPQFVQELDVKPINRINYFTVGISTVGSADQIAP